MGPISFPGSGKGTEISSFFSGWTEHKQYGREEVLANTSGASLSPAPGSESSAYCDPVLWISSGFQMHLSVSLNSPPPLQPRTIVECKSGPVEHFLYFPVPQRGKEGKTGQPRLQESSAKLPS